MANVRVGIMRGLELSCSRKKHCNQFIVFGVFIKIFLIKVEKVLSGIWVFKIAVKIFF